MKRLLILAASAALYAGYASAAPLIQEVKTDSGYTVWLAEDHTLPITTISLMFEHSGSAYDAAGKEGTASYLTQMLDEGAGNLDSLTFHKALEDKAIRYSAGASEDAITVTVQALSEYKGDALHLLLLSLTQPRFDTDALERIRASITSDLTQLEQEPGYIASRQWKEHAFAGHPYAHPRRGTPASVKTITAEDLHQFAGAHFFSATIPLIAVAGDVTPEEIRHWPFPPLARASTPAPLQEVSMPAGTTPHIVTYPVPQTVALASLPGLARNDPHYYALQVLNYVLGGNSITSRLGMQVRNEKGLAYHIGTDIEVMDKAAFISANFATRNAAAGEALALFRSVLGDIASKGISEQELKDAKSYLTGSFPLEHDTQGELVNFLLGIQHFRLGIDYPEKRNSLIEHVALAEVNALAKSQLSSVPLVVMAGRPVLESSSSAP